MDKTALVAKVSELFRLNGHTVECSVKLGNREIDIVAQEQQGLIKKKILIECAEYKGTVGVEKIKKDFDKLSSAREVLKEAAVLGSRLITPTRRPLPRGRSMLQN